MCDTYRSNADLDILITFAKRALFAEDILKVPTMSFQIPKGYLK